MSLPCCARCGREAKKRYYDGRLCKRCYSDQHLSAECSRCGRHRTVTTRTEAGKPVCGSCWARDPKNHESCGSCGELSMVYARRENGAVCRRCYDEHLAPLDTCDVCGELFRINSRKGGKSVCRRCYEGPKRRCGECGRLRTIVVRATGSAPDICDSCWKVPTAICGRCGTEDLCINAKSDRPSCLRCRLADRVKEIFTGPGGEIEPRLLKLRDAVVASRDPKIGFQWLRRGSVGETLEGLASGTLALSHEALDGLPSGVWLEHLRDILVASGALPERNAEMLRLERSISEVAAGIGSPEDAYILKTFGVWCVLGRVRRRLERGEEGAYTTSNARRRFLEASRFVRWLNGMGKGVPDCTQADVDAYLAGAAKSRLVVRHFVVWATRQGVLDKDITAPTIHDRGDPTSRVDFGARLGAARRLLRDETLDAAQRMAGALVVIYAQPAARVARLTLDDVMLREGQVYLRLGKNAVLMPDTLGSLLIERPWRRRGGVAGRLSEASDWLFPGERAGKHIHPEQLSRRLNQLGKGVRLSRNTALTQLAAEVPSAILADTLGIHPKTADKWAKRSGGKWSDYAARRAKATDDA